MGETRFGEVDDHLLAEVRDDAPNFANTGGGTRVHDWRTYVGERVAEIWATLPEDVRLAIALDAQEQADREDWD